MTLPDKWQYTVEWEEPTVVYREDGHWYSYAPVSPNEYWDYILTELEKQMIDLQWGTTEEEMERSRILTNQIIADGRSSLVISQIEDRRALILERYGNVEAAIAAHPWPDLQPKLRTMDVGVLTNPAEGYFPGKYRRSWFQRFINWLSP